jgi:hypothetical protein
LIEFEAVAPPDSDLSAERERVQQLRDAYDITTDQLIPSSYSAQTCCCVLEMPERNRGS